METNYLKYICNECLQVYQNKYLQVFSLKSIFQAFHSDFLQPIKIS